MESLTTRINDHNSTIKSISSTITSMGLDKVGRSTAGVFVTPAVWALDYSVNGNSPDSIDWSLYIAGLSNPLVGFATSVTGIFKSIVDDDTNAKLREIQAGEQMPYAKFIKACYHYAPSPAQINAMTIANHGGTAWQHENGLWVYITDAKNRMVHDFLPRSAVVVYQPKIPFERDQHGNFLWRTRK